MAQIASFFLAQDTQNQQPNFRTLIVRLLADFASRFGAHIDDPMDRALQRRESL